jgi:NTP pyrophosphatase (non-canonical NTP hydrolase)
VAHDDLIDEIERRIERTQERYGDFASTHEALGVASEEWDELREAVRRNALAGVEQECLDLAAVLIRLARMLRNVQYEHARSLK